MTSHNDRGRGLCLNDLPPDIQELVSAVIGGVMALAYRAVDSNSDSNPLGGTNYFDLRAAGEGFTPFWLR